MSEEKRKTIILTCRQSPGITLPCIEKYEGVELLETPHGTIAFCLGTKVMEVGNTDNAKVVIDAWNKLKLN